MCRSIDFDGHVKDIWVDEEYPVEVTKTCPVCDGDLITRSHAVVGDALGRLAETLMRAGLQDALAVRSYWDGVWVLNELAFDDERYADGLGRGAARALRNAQRRAGSPAAFVARVADVADVPGGAILMTVTEEGQCVAVAVPGRAAGLAGKDCLIAGIVRGHDATLPLIGAAAVRAVHKADPKYRTRNPAPMPEDLTRLTQRRPVYIEPPAGTPSPAETLLAKARMYALNNLKAKAIGLLKQIRKEHPGTDQAEAALELLGKLDPVNYPPKKR